MTDKKKTSQAQIKATRKWEKKNPLKTKIDTYRRNARVFVRHYAEDKDIDELLEIYRKENPNCKKW